MSETEQSDIGKELNRVVLETGVMPLDVMKQYMEIRARSVGNHIFVYKPKVEDKPDSV